MPADESLRSKVEALLAEARRIVAALEALLDSVPPPPPPEEPEEPPQPTVEVVGGPGSLTFRWQQPAGAPRALVSWGRAGAQVGKRFLDFDAGPVEVTVQVPGSLTYAVDVLVAPVGGEYVLLASGEGTSLPASVVEPPAEPTGRPRPPADVNDAAGWERWKTEMRAWCGAPRTGLRPVAGPADVAGLGPVAWNGGDLHVLGPVRLAGLDIAGRIYVNAAGILLDVEDVRCHAIHWGRDMGGSWKAKRLTCTGTRPGYPLGQGAVNHWSVAAGWTLDRADLAGSADGMQVASNGRITDLYVHDLAIGRTPSGGTTHNDGIQIYGGEVVVDGYLFEALAAPPDHVNGFVITNGSTAVLRGSNVHASVSAGNNVVNPHLGRVYLRHSVLAGGRIPYRHLLFLEDSVVG